jgi:Lysyl oxidase
MLAVFLFVAFGSPAAHAGPESYARGTGQPTGATEPTGGGTGATEPPETAPSCPVRLRCPDLIMSAPFHLHIDRTTIPGRVLLRAASSIDNHGSGPLELRAHRTGRYGTVVYQAIYGRNGRAHLFRTKAKLIYKYIPGYRYEHQSVENLSYWKLRHAAAFQLWSVDAQMHAIELVRTGPKVDYCLRDLFRTLSSPISPREAVYPACSQDPNMRRDVLGTSVGWSDVYPYEYPQQWIDVTGLRGRFAYVQIADPENLLRESNHRNDISETYVQLPSGRALGRRVGVSRP